jgi:STE24 endopeptidase
MKALRSILAVLHLARALAGGAHAQAASAAQAAPAASAPTPRFHIRPADDAWRASLPRDADAATQAYMDRLPADVVASSNAYFEGGYWLQLWNFLLGLAISWLLLRRQISARVRDICKRVGRFGVLRDALYGAFFSIASWVISLPLTIYQGYFREHQYQMATQTFGPWLVDQLVMLGAQTCAFALALAVLYAVIRHAGERWWIWGTVASMALLVFAVMIGPVWVDPLTNTYKPVSDPTIKAAVLQMAHADEVPVDEVYEFDASRQTTRVSANVSGLGGTAAIRLNDNLLRRASPAEIRAVMGHEIGHYAMHHAVKALAMMAIVLFVGFGFSAWAMRRLLARWGTRWHLGEGVADVGSLPLLAAVLGVYLYLATPVLNTIIRTMEEEADLW